SADSPSGTRQLRSGPRSAAPGRDRGCGASEAPSAGPGRSRIQPKFGRNRNQCVAHDLDVRVEWHTQRLGAASQLLAVDSPREGLVLHLLAHGSRVDRRQRAVWLHKGARDDEAAHLVHGIEGFADRGVARNAQVFGVRGDVAQSILWPAPLTEHRDAAVGVLLGGGTALVVPVVDEAEHAPALLALTEAAGVRSHSRLDAAHVAAQVLALR